MTTRRGPALRQTRCAYHPRRGPGAAHQSCGNPVNRAQGEASPGSSRDEGTRAHGNAHNNQNWVEAGLRHLNSLVRKADRLVVLIL